MPFFSFSLNEIKPSFTKYNITSNNVYFSKNTNLWKLLNKENNSQIKFLKREKRLPATKITENILFCLPPSIGLGDAIEYAMAIKKLSEKIQFDSLGVAFTGEHEIIFEFKPEKFISLHKTTMIFSWIAVILGFALIILQFIKDNRAKDKVAETE